MTVNDLEGMVTETRTTRGHMCAIEVALRDGKLILYGTLYILSAVWS